MRIGICDDNLKDCYVLKKMLSEFRQEDEIEYFTECSALLDEIQSGMEFTCLFLDIIMPEMSGIELVSRIRELLPENQIYFIFVTTSPDFAVEAFAHRAVHYIMKPLKKEDVAEALNRIPNQIPQRFGIMIKTKAAKRFIYLDEIAACESNRHEVHIKLKTEETLICYQTIDSLRQQLGDDFLLISRGLLVNMDYIEQMGGKSCVLKDQRKILLSRKNLKQIHDAYNDFIFSRLI